MGKIARTDHNVAANDALSLEAGISPTPMASTCRRNGLASRDEPRRRWDAIELGFGAWAATIR
ncbi:hypothetical protein [Gemmatimonas sp.]|uniref:hypothetical protein n=1 Tax=Gemmatimonas sp. TaxID=1962908 RepID=UPI003983D19D